MKKLSLAVLPFVLTLLAAPAMSLADQSTDVASVSVMADEVAASEAQPVQDEEKKCLKNGKPCTKGKNCKPENCKKEEPKEEGEEGGMEE